MSNILDSNVTDSERYALSLQSFDGACKLCSLSIQFEDKKILLKDEMEKIIKAKDFLLEYKRYDRAIYRVLFNKNLTEESVPPVRRTPVRRSHSDIEAGGVAKKEDTNKNLWDGVAAYVLPTLVGIAAVFGIGMGGRNRMRARLRATEVLPVAALLPLLAPVVEAQSVEGKIVSTAQAEKSGSTKNSHYTPCFSDDIVGQFSLLKCLLSYLGRRSLVERMNQAEVAQEKMTSEPITLEQRVEKAFKVYDVINDTNAYDEMIAFQVKSTVRTKSANRGGVIGKNASIFFRSACMPIQSTVNDPPINASWSNCLQFAGKS